MSELTAPNWGAVTDETVRLLQGMLRLDTSNPPGHEIVAAEHTARILTGDGVEPILMETAPKRGNVIARLKGDGTAAPLLLYSHLDVVPVEREKWTRDPFGGELHDGHVYGRGALDMKGIGAMQLMVFLLLKREGARLKRDVILAATADEETSGNQGIGLIVERQPELLRAEYALSEFGGFSMRIAGKTFYPVQTSEKGTCWFRVRAKGRPGHASVPHGDNAVVHLARAVDKIATASMPIRMTRTAQGFMAGLGDGMGGPLGGKLNALAANGAKLSARDADAIFADRDLRAAGLADELYAITHDTITPTGLRAGRATNVIPSEAEVVLDSRTIPGSSAETMLRDLKRALGERAASLEFIVDSDSSPLEFEPDTPLFKLISKTLKQHDPQAIPLPYMMTGATDAKHVAKLGATCYGFSPMKFAPGERFSELVHGHDERIAVDSLGWGVRALYEVVREFCVQ